MNARLMFRVSKKRNIVGGPQHKLPAFCHTGEAGDCRLKQESSLGNICTRE